MTQPFLDECVSVLTRTPAIFDLLLRDLPDVLTTADEGPATWSPTLVLRHLIFAEQTDWMPRLIMIFNHGDTRIFEPFDHDGQFLSTEGKALPELLTEFTNLRRGGIARLRSMNLTGDQLEKTGRHPMFGLVTARQLLATWTSHDLAHLMQMSRVMAKRYKLEVGPWLPYQTVMK